MHRRTFSRRLALAVGAGALLPACDVQARNEQPQERASQQKARLRAKPLKTGDTVGLITPGSYIPDRDLAKAMQNMASLGLQVKPGKHLRALRGFTAGTDEQRLDDLHSMFADPEVDAIWCARGGYGCTRLLPNLDFELIRRNPKILIGYSDITALTTAIFQETGLICFHGPVAASTFTPYTRQQLQEILFSARDSHTIRPSEAYADREDPLYQSLLLQSGTARGLLIGGNLSLLASLAGTPWALQPAGKLIFIEDVEEKPYRIDRMLTQLAQSSPLDQAAGFALGIFAGCIPEPNDRSLSLSETLAGQFTPMGKPTVYGLTFGHIAHQCTLPVGVQAELRADQRTIQLLESWLVDA